MGREGDDSEVLASTRSDSGDTGDEAEQGRFSHLLGGLLIELGRKVQLAGIEGVRIFSAEDVEGMRLKWFRVGWEEHARTSDRATYFSALTTGGEGSRRPGHPADAETEYAPVPGKLLSFPHRTGAESEPSAAEKSAAQPLPVVEVCEASVHDLMAHRPRLRCRPREVGGSPRLTEA